VNIDTVRDLLDTGAAVAPHGRDSKPGLHAPGRAVRASSGILAYHPEEFVFTAKAATPISEMVEVLANRNQHLPVDPPFAHEGSLGGLVASGLSGPGRFRYGGVRDFLLGIRFVDGQGAVYRGGGRVVKNASGFDFPKLFVGSLGAFGLLLEVTFKVFPAPQARRAFYLETPDFATAHQVLIRLANRPFDLEALDLLAPRRLYLRLAGRATAIDKRLRALTTELEPFGEVQEAPLETDPARMEGEMLVFLPTAPSELANTENALSSILDQRRYQAGGTGLWGTLPESRRPELARALGDHGLTALVARGRTGPWLGIPPKGEPFFQRVKSVLDPKGRFPNPFKVTHAT